MVKLKSFFDSLVQRDLHVNNCNFYIAESLKLGVWGRDIHIFPLSIALRRSINVYNHIGKSNEELVGGQAYCGVNITQFEPLLLLYENNNHFNGILKRKQCVTNYFRQIEVFSQKL